MGDNQEIKTIIRNWVVLDDESRQLAQRQKAIRDEKARISDTILSFMRDNQVDNFAIEGKGGLSRSVRSSRPALRRDTIRTQLLLQFADEPQRVAEVMKAIEGTPETGRELLVRHVPREKKISLA
jgi:hypothetical protein